MKRFLLLTFLLSLIFPAQARVIYIVNFGRINIEEKCQDSKADHQVWHMDVRGKIQTLNLKGHGDKYFRNPELIPSGIYRTENGILCSQRQLTKKEIEAYEKKVINSQSNGPSTTNSRFR